LTSKFEHESFKIVETRQQEALQAAEQAAQQALQAAADAQALQAAPQDQAQQAPEPPVQQAAPPAINMAFSLSPATTTNNIIDYSTSDGMKLFTKATKPQKTEFDGSADGLRLFLGNFRDHANTSNWTANITVTTATGTRDLPSRYGQITEAELATHIALFNNTQTRLAQNSAQMIIYLKESLEDNFKLEVYMQAGLYTIAGTEVGELFLWQIIKLVNADTRATIGHIREQLTLLPRVVATLNSDVKEINKWINNQMAALHSRGKTSEDLMINIFKGYAVVNDKQFVSYIADLRTQYEDGRIDMDADKLMTWGYQKYKNLGLADTLAAPAVDKADIVALKTQTEEILALKSTVERLEAQVSGKKNPGGSGGGDNGKWAWKAVAPKANQALSKQVNNKTYHWCPTHAKWCIHTPAECKGLTKSDVPSSVTGTSTTGTTTTTMTTPRTEETPAEASKRKLELTNAFNAFVLDADDGEDCI
jgi:hypothetical protein